MCVIPSSTSVSNDLDAINGPRYNPGSIFWHSLRISYLLHKNERTHVYLDKSRSTSCKQVRNRGRDALPLDVHRALYDRFQFLLWQSRQPTRRWRRRRRCLQRRCVRTQERIVWVQIDRVHQAKTRATRPLIADRERCLERRDCGCVDEEKTPVCCGLGWVWWCGTSPRC